MIPKRDGVCISKKDLTKIGKNLNAIWKVSGEGVRPILRPFSIRVISDTKVTSKVESRFYKPQQIGIFFIYPDLQEMSFFLRNASKLSGHLILFL